MEVCAYCGQKFRLKFGESCLFHDKPFCSEKCREQFCSLPSSKRKKRSFKIKCFGLLSVFAIIFGCSLNVYSDTSALRYEYAGISFRRYEVPELVYNSSTNKYEVGQYDPSNSISVGSFGGMFQLTASGGAYQSEYDNLSMKKDTAFMSLVYDSSIGKCVYNDSVYDSINYSIGLNNMLPWNNSGNILDIQNRTVFTNPDWLSSSDINSDYGCYLPSRFGSSEKPDFDTTSLPSGNNAVLACDKGNGLTCGHLEFIGNIYNNNLSPFWFSADGFYIHNSVVSSDGVTYSNSFSFYDMFNGGSASKAYIPTFSRLAIPFASDYFLDSSNLTANRQIEFSGAFEFDGSFAWNPNINDNGSYWRVETFAFSANTGQDVSWNFDCTANVLAVGDNKTQVAYSCPTTLPDDLVFLDAYMVIDGNNDYVWETDDEWRFYYNYYTTDNDTTSGGSFNTNILGQQSNIIGSAQDNVPSDDGVYPSEYFDQLTNLFNFSVFNPFAPIFNLFTNGNSCASIPIIAGMLHAESSQYCSWFPSSVRNVLTPVFSIVSVMLIFGFFVHWLGSSSGNLFEDAGSHTSGRIHVTTKGGK